MLRTSPISEAKHFGIKRRQQTVDMIEEVHEIVIAWPEVFSKYNVPEKDAEIIGKDINHRLNKIDVSLKKTYRSRFHP
jgi:hypothetical protein